MLFLFDYSVAQDFGYNITHTTVYGPLGFCLELPGWAGHQKGKTSLDLLEHAIGFNGVFFEQAHTSHPWTDFDNLYVIGLLFTQGCAFVGTVDLSPFNGSNPPKP